MEKGAKQRIKEALIELLKEKDFEKISIMDIVRRAGVGRSTYYYHYFEQREVLDDLFNDVFAHLLQAQMTETDERLRAVDRNALIKHTYSLSRKVVDYLLEYRDMLSVLFSSSVAEEFNESYRTYFETQYTNLHPGRTPYDHYLCDYLCAGQFHLLEQLVKHGRKEDRDTMANLMFDINWLITEGMKQQHDEALSLLTRKE
jgi:AcrR family transcriptional regulator